MYQRYRKTIENGKT